MTTEDKPIVKVKCKKDRIVYSDFKDGYLIEPDKVVSLYKTHWVEKRILTGDLILIED